MKYASRLQYQTTNNEVEYEALLKGLGLAKSLGAESIVVQGDSQLIMGQVNGTCEAKQEQMKKYLSKVKCLIKKFKEASFLQKAGIILLGSPRWMKVRATLEC